MKEPTKGFQQYHSNEDLGTISQVTGVTSPTRKNERKDCEEDAEA